MINGIITSEAIMGQIQAIYPKHFRNYKIRFTSFQVTYLLTETKQDEEILKEHNRAQRGMSENKIQIAEKLYFPNIKEKITNLIKQCRVCKEQKYDMRNPPNPE